MARTKRGRRSYSAGEWGRNRVRVFPDPKTGLLQIEWRENGRRLSRSLGHRDWSRAKRQADEFAAGFAKPEPNGQKQAAPEPLTLGTLFDIYGEEVTPTKGKGKGKGKGEPTQWHDKAAMRMFLGFLRTKPKPGDSVATGLGSVHPGAAGGQDRTERQAGVRPDHRARPEVPDRGLQLGGEVEGRTGTFAS